MYRHGEWDDEYTSHINHYVRLREEQARKYRAIMNRRKKEQEKKIVIDKTLDLFAKPNFRSRYPKELRLCIIIEHEHGAKDKDCRSLSRKYNIPYDTVWEWVNYGKKKGDNNG